MPTNIDIHNRVILSIFLVLFNEQYILP